MTASSSYYKRAYLLDILQSSEWDPKPSHQVRLLAKTIETNHHLDQILPFADNLFIHLQLCLSWFIHTHIRREKYFPQ